jgi:hypothetical protein
MLPEHCNVHSPDGGFSGWTTGGILTSQHTSGDSAHSPQGVLPLKWRELFFEVAGRIMPHDQAVISTKLS